MTAGYNWSVHRSIRLLVLALLLGAASHASVHLKDLSWPVQFRVALGAPGFVAETQSGRIRIAADGWSGLDNAGHSLGGLRFQASSRSAAFDASEPAGQVSEFVGKDPRNWIRGATAYGRIRLTNIYPGVDVVYYGSQGWLEFDFIIASQADLRRISLVWTGPGFPRLDADGSLVLSLEPGGIKLAAPVAYQMSGKARTAVACRYAVKGKLVSFRVGSYDRARKLVIDPKFLFSGLVRNLAQSVATDRDGNLYLAGIGFGPPTPGAYQYPFNTAFVTKRSKNGNTLWTASVGPVNLSTQVSLGVDASGAVFLAGGAYQDYAVTSGAFPRVDTFGLQRYGFVSKISSDGSTLLKSTLLTSSLFGGDGADAVTALAVSPEGQVTVSGTLFVFRSSLPGELAQIRQPGGFAARLSEDWTNVVYSRTLRTIPSLVAIDDRGNAVLGGVGVEADESPATLQRGSLDASLYTSLDSGVTIHAQRGLPVSVGITVDPNSPLTMRATTGGVFKSSDGGLTWQAVELGSSGASYTGVWIHPKKPLLRFASGFEPSIGTSLLYRSEDGGESWESVRVLPRFSTFFDVGDRIMANPGPYYSIDDGKSWDLLRLNNYGINTCCVVDSSNPRHFLISSSDINSAPLETVDGGVSFLQSRSVGVMPLAFDPHFSSVLYGYNKGLSDSLSGYYVFAHTFMKSEDGGFTWRYPRSGVRIAADQVAVDPSGSGRMYLFGLQGVWRSDDRGENWSPIPGQLGNAPLFDGYVRFGNVDWIYALARPQGDASITKLDAAGSIVFSTLVGGRNSDKVQAIAITANGDIVMGGTTQSDDLLAAAGAPVRSQGGFEQGFLARLSADGSALLAFRYVGGSSTDSIKDLALLSSGEVAVVGGTASHDHPDVTPDALQPQLPAAYDGFLGVFSIDTFTPRYFSYLGSTAGGLNKVVTTGMKAYVIGSVFNSELGGVTLACEDPTPPACTNLLAEVDLTP